MRVQQNISVIFLSALLLLSLSLAFAQEATEPPEPPPTLTETPLPTEPPTLTPTSTETATLLPSETPTSDPTATETASSPETLPTNPVPEIETTPEAETTAELTAVVESTNTPLPLLPEPPLVAIVSEAFAAPHAPGWQIGSGWQIHPHEANYVLQAVNPVETVSYIETAYVDSAVELLLQMQHASFELILRGQYRLHLSSDGQVVLYRDMQVLGEAVIPAFTPDQWRHIRFSAMGDTLRVAIDGVEVIALRDPSPVFAAGQVAFHASFHEQADSSDQPQNILLLDNIRFWIPDNQTVATETPIALPVDQFTVIIPPEAVPNQLVISFHAGASPQERQNYLRQVAGRTVREIPRLNAVVIELPGQAAQRVLQRSNALRFVQPNYRVTALSDDPLYTQQWGLNVIGAPQAWTALPANLSAITVAVIDSGICLTHPDLQGRILTGWDFVENDAIPQDDFGHGCGVAGIIAANTNNGMGMAGIAPNAQIMPLRVLDNTGQGTYADVAAAIIYAADNGVPIVNLSLGGTYPASVLEDAVNYATQRGVVLVAAAGNTGGAVLYPAAYVPVIAVASIDPNLQMSSFSSRGQEIDLLAPGRDILTTTNNGGYALRSGTSFAAPHVAAVAVLEMVLGGNLTVDGGIVAVNGTTTTVTPTATLTSTPTTTATSTPPTDNSVFPDVQQQLIYAYDPDVEDIAASPNWIINTSSVSVVADSGDSAVQVSSGYDPMIFILTELANVTVSARFQLATGQSAQLKVRQTDQGAYIVDLDSSGLVRLWRAGEVLATAAIPPIAAGQWHTLQLASHNEFLQLSVDGIPLMTVRDANPLPGGEIVVGSGGDGADTILVDSMKIWLPANEIPWRSVDELRADLQSDAFATRMQALETLLPMRATGNVEAAAEIIYPVTNLTELVAALELAQSRCTDINRIDIMVDTITIPAAYSGLDGLPLVTCGEVIINGNGAPGGFGVTIQRDINSPDEFRIFHATGGRLFLANVTVQHGQLPFSVHPAANGAGILNVGGELVIVNARVQNNLNNGFWGGGILSSAGSLTLYNSLVSDNTTIRGCCGGGVGISLGSFLINTTRIERNIAPTGAGLAVQGASGSLEDSIVDSNHVSVSTSGGGGGISFNTGIIPATFSILRTRISNNVVAGINGSGGGIEYHDNSGQSLLTITDSAILNNIILDRDSGGGVFVSSATLTISNSCITGNSDIAVNAHLNAVINAAGNWWGDSSGPEVNGNGSPGDSVGGYGTVIYTNPLTTPPPCGAPAPTQFNVIVVDAASGAGTQAQAIEDIPPPGNPDDGICTVREAIEKANYWSSTENPDPNMPFPDCTPNGSDPSRPNEVIVNLYPTTYTLYYPLPPISGSVYVKTDEVNYPNSFATIVRSDIVTEKFRIFEITSEQGASLTLENIIVSNGHAEGNGGGILNAGTLTLINSAVIDNYSTGNGGGIYNTGTATITGSCITGNTSLNGASVHSTTPMTATNNWWGAADGPSGEGTGSGDSVNAAVVFIPYLDTPPIGRSVPCDYNELPATWSEDGVPVQYNQIIPELEHTEDYGTNCPSQGEPGFRTAAYRRPCAVISYNNYRNEIETNGDQIIWGYFISLIIYSEGHEIMLGYLDSNNILQYSNPQISYNPSDNPNGARCWRYSSSINDFVSGTNQCISGVQRHFPWAVGEWLLKECALELGFSNYRRSDGTQYSGTCTEAGLVTFLGQMESLYSDPSGVRHDPYLYLQRAEYELNLWGFTKDPNNPESRAYGTCPCSFGNVSGPTGIDNFSDPEYGRNWDNHSFSYFFNPVNYLPYFRIE